MSAVRWGAVGLYNAAAPPPTPLPASRGARIQPAVLSRARRQRAPPQPSASPAEEGCRQVRVALSNRIERGPLSTKKKCSSGGRQASDSSRPDCSLLSIATPTCHFNGENEGDSSLGGVGVGRHLGAHDGKRALSSHIIVPNPFPRQPPSPLSPLARARLWLHYPPAASPLSPASIPARARFTCILTLSSSFAGGCTRRWLRSKHPVQPRLRWSR